jgi:hypothetical protein
MSEPTAPLPASRALTIIAEARETARSVGNAYRPDSGFLAQLVAIRADAEQYRQRRRAPVSLALAAYGKAKQLAA